ncbi:unnamed protein product [Mesocestoides corti]|uniref:gamma-glutamylcyclotransferase n=1 Tax=Mesocestoides corti TaxID=53468 RepID=A0A0R3U670_MESCO|nr:unnamed protein product [Mesocestoides corti]
MAPCARFYYFAYGSNLLNQRIILSNPTALFVGVGRLANHRVAFRSRDEACAWGPHSATATIEPSVDDCVYGAVWTLALDNMGTLDKQEGVPRLYRPLEVTVTVPSRGNESIVCRTYKMLNATPGLPSPYYLDIILRGAVQSGLPQEYIAELRKHSCNDYLGKCSVYGECLSLMPDDEMRKFEVDKLRIFFESREPSF